MGEKRQGLRKDWRRRINDLGSGDIRILLSKIKIDRRNSETCSLAPSKSYNASSLKSCETPSVAVVHESWIPTEIVPLCIKNTKMAPNHQENSSCISSTSQEESQSPAASPLASPLASPYTSPAFTPTIEVLSATTESELLDEDTRDEDTSGSSTTIINSSLCSKGITLIDRPLSDRFSGQVLDNREQSIISCEPLRSKHSNTGGYSKRDLRNRPLPPSPPLVEEGGEMIQTLRAELVAKARELNDEKKTLESVITEIRRRYERINENNQGSLERPSYDGASLDSRLQWVEFESNCLKIENEILNKKVSNKLHLEQELLNLKEENNQLSSNLGRLQDLNKRVVELEHHTAAAGGPDNDTSIPQTSAVLLSPSCRESQNYRELREQMAQVQSELLANAAEQRAEWDVERQDLLEKIKNLQVANTSYAEQLEKSQHKCRYLEHENLRVEASYTALSESLKQQKARFQHQLKAIEEKLMAIEYAGNETFRFEKEVDESLQAQRDLSRGHQQLFQLQEHYMKVLERFHANIRAIPRNAGTQSKEVQDALNTLRQFDCGKTRE